MGPPKGKGPSTKSSEPKKSKTAGKTVSQVVTRKSSRKDTTHTSESMETDEAVAEMRFRKVSGEVITLEVPKEFQDKMVEALSWYNTTRVSEGNFELLHQNLTEKYGKGISNAIIGNQLMSIIGR